MSCSCFICREEWNCGVLAENRGICPVCAEQDNVFEATLIRCLDDMLGESSARKFVHEYIYQGKKDIDNLLNTIPRRY